MDPWYPQGIRLLLVESVLSTDMAGHISRMTDRAHQSTALRIVFAIVFKGCLHPLSLHAASDIHGGC
jgi:hypothetical protein